MPAAQMDFAPNRNWTTDADWRDLGTNMRAGEARRIFAKNLGEKGGLDEVGFYRDIAAAGLGPEHAKDAMDWYSKSKAADVATALANQQLRAMGSDPNAQGRHGAQIGAPIGVEERNPEAAPAYDMTKDKDIPPDAATQPQKTRSTLDEWWDKIRGVRPASMPAQASAMSPADAEQVRAQQAAPSGASQASPQTSQQPNTTDAGDLGSSRIFPATLPPLPAGAGQSATTLRPGPDNRSARQMVEDSFDPSQTLAARFASAQQPGAADASIFDWKPVDNGSNQYQQFSQALGAKLKGIGALDAQGNPDPSKYLQQVYSSTVASNMPPAPNPALMNQGLEGLSKYEGEVQAYQAAITKAKGLGEAAVLKAKNDLVDYAKQFGVDTVEQRKTEIPGGTLRDTSKRTEAAALVTNKQNIENAANAVRDAVDANGPNVTKLMLAAPQVIRAYATALNPGQQLGEGNLLEVSRVMYPEVSGPKLVNIAAALGRGLRNNDWSGFKTITDAIDATAPQALFQRMQTLTREADKLNSISLNSYIAPTEQSKKKLTHDDVGAAIGWKAKPGTIKAPIDLSAGAIPEVGQYYIHKGKVMRRDK